MKCAYDNLTKMPLVKSPVFIAHGTNDELIEFSMSNELAAVAKFGVTKVDIDGATHGTIFRDGGTKLMREFGAFVEKVTGSAQ
jgi:fermentation-respiration switch protein FrsA (DUF1100 family)